MPSLSSGFANSDLLKSLLKEKLLRFTKTKDRAKQIKEESQKRLEEMLRL
jgi:hypothetical protein